MRLPCTGKCTPFERLENKKISAKKYLFYGMRREILFSGYYFLILCYTSSLGEGT